MLTIDDLNAIYKKYEFNNFFYKITSISNKPIDFIETDLMIDHSNCELFYSLCVKNCFWTGGYYLKSKTSDTYIEMDLTNPHEELSLAPPSEIWEEYDLYLHMFVDLELTQEITNLTWHPVSSLTMSVYANREYMAKKIYLDFHGHTAPETVLAGVCEKGEELSSVPVLEDNDGYYINAFIDDYSKPLFAISYDDYIFYGRIMMLNTLPYLCCSNLYRGTPQSIQLFNEDTGEEITEFQAYYQGKRLKDNIIELPFDAPDIIDVTIDLLSPDYVMSTVKLKVNTELKVCNTYSQVREAIDSGIKTMRVVSSSNGRVNLYIENLKDVTFINSKIGFIGDLDNVTIIETDDYEGQVLLTDNYIRGSFYSATLNNCTLENITELRISTDSVLNNCTLKNIDLIRLMYTDRPHKLLITGSVINCNIERLLLISDGELILKDNNFTGLSGIDYFPNFLYLTGDYTVTGNTFNLIGLWTEPSFNMCIIKANNEFNPSSFINNNTFDLNIRYQSEPRNTFYYNIVDDDKIRAVRLQ